MTTNRIPERIFIDTSSLIAAKFFFAGGRLLRLAEAVHEVGPALLLPDVIRLEIEEHLHLQAKEESELFKSSLTDARKWPSLLSRLPPPRDLELEINDELSKAWSTFQQAFGSVDTIPSSNANLDEVVGWYFERSPPFGESLDKRHEFPDAIALSCLLAESELGCIDVITDDKRMREFCKARPESFHVWDDVPSLTSHLIECGEEVVQILMASASEIISDDEGPLTSELRETLSNIWLRLDEQPDGEVHSHSIVSAEIGNWDVQSIERQEGWVEVELAFDASVGIKAEVSYGDESSSYRDDDTKERYYLRTIEGVLSTDLDLTGTAVLHVYLSESTYEVISLDLDERDVQLSVDDGDLVCKPESIPPDWYDEEPAS